MESTDRVDNAAALMKAGKIADARDILERVVISEPRNVRAWYTLSYIAPNKDKAMYCLGKVLELQPKHKGARKRLKKLRGFDWGFVGTVLSVIAISSVVMVLFLMYGGPVIRFVSPFRFITYKVYGSSWAQVTYANEQSGIEQHEIRPPWEKDVSSVLAGTDVSLVATNYGGGEITCEIWVNDKPWRKSTSSGVHATTTCSGTVGLP